MIDFNHRLRIMSSYDVVVDSDRIYLMSEITNVFFDASLKDNELFCCYLPDEYFLGNLIIRLTKLGSSILLIPWNASSIFIYDMYKKEMKKVSGIFNSDESQISGKFINAIAYEQRVILVGENIHAIIFLEGFDAKGKIKIKKVNYDKKYKFTSIYSIHDSILYLPIRDDMKIMSVSLIDYEVKIISLDSSYDILKSNTINLIKNNIVIFNKYNCQVSVKLEKPYKKEETLLINKESVQYQKIYHIGNYWVYFDMHNGKIGIRHEECKEIENILFNIDTTLLKYKRDSENLFIFVKEYEDKIIFQDRLSGKCYYLNINARSINEISINICKDQYEEIINKWKESLIDYNKHSQLTESEFFDLCDFLECV